MRRFLLHQLLPVAAIAAALALAFCLYADPLLMVRLAEQLWACL